MTLLLHAVFRSRSVARDPYQTRIFFGAEKILPCLYQGMRFSRAESVHLKLSLAIPKQFTAVVLSGAPQNRLERLY